MAQKKVEIPEIGLVTLSKRRGSKNLRISIAGDGTVRVNMPPWVPYAAGVKFAKDKADWLSQQRAKIQTPIFKNSGQVGKSHRLIIQDSPGTTPNISARVTTTEVIVKTNLPINSHRVITKLTQACEEALRTQSQALLPIRLQTLAKQHGYSYKAVKIKKLTSRWGSCSSAGTITLSYYLIQLPWSLIDYVLLHELVHTKQMNHSQSFWADMAKAMPQTKMLRKEIKQHQPVLKIN